MQLEESIFVSLREVAESKYIFKLGPYCYFIINYFLIDFFFKNHQIKQKQCIFRSFLINQGLQDII